MGSEMEVLLNSGRPRQGWRGAFLVLLGRAAWLVTRCPLGSLASQVFISLPEAQLAICPHRGQHLGPHQAAS